MGDITGLHRWGDAQILVCATLRCHKKRASSPRTLSSRGGEGDETDRLRFKGAMRELPGEISNRTVAHRGRIYTYNIGIDEMSVK